MSSFEFKIKVQIPIFQILYSVDRLAQSTNFRNLLELNQTTLSKEKLFLLTWCTSVQICKNIKDWKYLFQWSKHGYTTQFLELEL
jgi:hypothetical protein